MTEDSFDTHLFVDGSDSGGRLLELWSKAPAATGVRAHFPTV